MDYDQWRRLACLYCGVVPDNPDAPYGYGQQDFLRDCYAEGMNSWEGAQEAAYYMGRGIAYPPRARVAEDGCCG